MHFTTGEEDREERGRGPRQWQRVAATAAAYLMTVVKSSTRAGGGRGMRRMRNVNAILSQA